jgi:hypothetical protein
MRPLIAIATLVVCTLNAAGGPIDSIQYRSALSTDLAPVSGLVQSPGETAYALPTSPLIGVVASGIPNWTPAYPAYPTAGFSVVSLGSLAPFTTESVASGHSVVQGSGRFTLDVDFRNSNGQVGSVTFAGTFVSGGGVSRLRYACPERFGGAAPVARWRPVRRAIRLRLAAVLSAA